MRAYELLTKDSSSSYPHPIGHEQAALAAVEGHFDVVAVQPTDEASFGAACNMDQQAVDMISMDLSRRQSFHFRYSQVGVAIQRGFYFEICYGAAIHGKGREEMIEYPTFFFFLSFHFMLISSPLARCGV